MAVQGEKLRAAADLAAQETAHHSAVQKMQVGILSMLQFTVVI